MYEQNYDKWDRKIFTGCNTGQNVRAAWVALPQAFLRSMLFRLIIHLKNTLVRHRYNGWLTKTYTSNVYLQTQRPIESFHVKCSNLVEVHARTDPNSSSLIIFYFY